MIFVTVGTHEQHFNRLLYEVDNLAGRYEGVEEFVVQKGFSDYKFENCESFNLCSPRELAKLVGDASCVVTHGGPSSFMELAASGKWPVVVPRQKIFGEHVNNHQLDFVKFLNNRIGGFIPVYQISDLDSAIKSSLNYRDNGERFNSNNREFTERLACLIDNLRGGYLD